MIFRCKEPIPVLSKVEVYAFPTKIKYFISNHFSEQYKQEGASLVLLKQ